MLASSTRALRCMPTTSCPASSLGWCAGSPLLPHELIFGRTPGRNHRVEILRCGAHGFNFRFAVPLLRGNKEAERLPMASDCERSSTFEVAREVLTELPNANLFGLHIAYPVYTIAYVEPADSLS